MSTNRGFARPALAGAVAFLLVAGLACPAEAQLVRDTLATFTAPSTLPMIAVDPDDGTPHVGYLDNSTFVHEWLVGSAWQSETAVSPITISTRLDSYSWDATSGGKVGFVWDAGDGTLRYAVRESGVWSSETVASNTGWTYAPSLVFDPHTGEPVLGFRAIEPRGADPGLNHIELGRRTGGVWSFNEVDTSSFDTGPPSLALTSDGQPRIAISREVGPEGGSGRIAYLGGVYYIETPSVTGPFAWTLVDSIGAGALCCAEPGIAAGTASLALNPWSDEPRIAYAYWYGNWGIRYAYRSGGVWASQKILNANAAVWAEDVSLTLTPAGDPRVVGVDVLNFLATDQTTNIGAGTAHIGSGIATANVVLLKRVGAEGTGPFSYQQVRQGVEETRSSSRAVVPSVADGVHIVWRSPPHSPPPSGSTRIVHAIDTPTTGVPPLHAPITGFAIEPNPLEAGSSLTVRLAVARAQMVELALIDVAGRRVASTEAQVEAGSSSVIWTPEGLRAGVYRVIARAKGARIGSAPVVILR